MASLEVQQPTPGQEPPQPGDASSQENDEEKQRRLDQKMEEMRQKNEQLRKRYEEIEADKRNANINSRIARSKDEDSGSESDEESDDDTQFPRGPSKEKVNRQVDTSPRSPGQEPQKISKGRGRTSTNAAAVPYQQPSHQNRQNDGHSAPPPDPKYNFLDDPVRRDGHGGGGSGGRGRGENTSTEFRRGGSRSSFEGNRGHFDSGHGKPMGVSRGRGRRSAEGQDYAAAPEQSGPVDHGRWKEERARIDAERLARQQTSSGQWKREWDVDKRQEDSRFGDRGPQRSQGSGSGWYEGDRDRQHYQRNQRGGRQQEYRNGGASRDYDSRGGNRQVYPAGRGFKVEVQDRDDRPGGFGSGGGGFGGRGRGRGYRQQNSDFGGFGQESGPGQDQEKPFGGPTRSPRGRGGPKSPGSRGIHTNQQPFSDSPKDQRERKGPAENRLQQEPSLDAPSSEYASPEPQLQKEGAVGGKAEGGHEDEEEQWEDVQEDGGHAEGYYFDDPHYGDMTSAGVIHHHPSDEMNPEDESALAAKLDEIEKQVRENSAQPDLEAAVVQETKQEVKIAELESESPLAMVEKEAGAGSIRRRQTTDGAGEGPELATEENERARHESMDQIERDMIAQLSENIRAVEAQLGGSEEDLELLLSAPGSIMAAPMLEGADDEELMGDEESNHTTAHGDTKTSDSPSASASNPFATKTTEIPKPVETPLEDEVD